VVPIHSILCHPRHPGSLVALHIGTHCGDQSFRPRTYHKSASKLGFLIHEQNQREVYSEVLIAGDLSEEDISQAGAHGIFTTSYPDTAEFVYDNHIVYLSQPSLSQLIPGGSGAGAFNQPTPLGVKYPPSKAHALTGGRASKSDTGAVLRYTPSDACQRCSSIF